MKAWVYILKDDKGRFYVGSTNDIERRLRQHKLGQTQTTKGMSNFKLVLSQTYDSIGTARKVEKRIKSFKRKDCVEKMVLDRYIKLK